MKRSLLIGLCLLVGAGGAFAQVTGSISVAADMMFMECNVVDAGALVQVYLGHVYTDGATASQFKLDVSATGWVHLGDMWAFPTVIGTSISGASVGYGACMAGTIYLGMVNFFGSSAPECTYISIVADPSSLSGEIEGVDCSETKFFPTGGQAIVNSNSSCNCGCPVEETTWGRIKATYR